jgi:hypothetical protein
VYQSTSGGAGFVPLESRGRVIGGSSTPRLAKMLSWKYSKMSALDVSRDLSENHARPVSREFVQSISSKVAGIAEDKEFEWAYEVPELPEVVTHISIGRDGTTTPIVKGGYREAMNGTISLYNGKGDRMHTIYATCAPEYGKKTFDMVLDMEIGQIKAKYPNVRYIGSGDGSKDNWTYLDSRTDVGILDFWHASTYLSNVSVAMGNNNPKQWLEDACHDLKHKPKGAKKLLKEMEHVLKKEESGSHEALQTSITYFQNNLKRMDYASYAKMKYPIGSGVTEAACKIMVKQRLCGSGMKWVIPNTEYMFLLRGLVLTEGRWAQFWENINNKGL